MQINILNLIVNFIYDKGKPLHASRANSGLSSSPPPSPSLLLKHCRYWKLAPSTVKMVTLGIKLPIFSLLKNYSLLYPKVWHILSGNSLYNVLLIKILIKIELLYVDVTCVIIFLSNKIKLALCFYSFC